MRSKPEGWCPNPLVYLLPMLGFLGTTLLVPLAAETSSFLNIVMTSKALALMPIILPAIIPESWGTVHAHPHDAHSAYTRLYRTISLASLTLHAKSTVAALIFNTPDSHYHRHNLVSPFGIRPQEFERSNFDRYTTAIGKVLGSLGDHPAVGAVGWDVLMSGLSLGIWASIRGLDAQQILALSGLWTRNEDKSLPKLAEGVVDGVKKEATGMAKGIADYTADA